jgi:DNA-binding winged helix-turn-helix (wHTH) protein
MRFLFDGHTLDLGRRELRLGAEPVALEPLVFDLLTYLVANRDRVVSKEEVLDSVCVGIRARGPHRCGPSSHWR